MISVTIVTKYSTTKLKWCLEKVDFHWYVVYIVHCIDLWIEHVTKSLYTMF